MAASEDLKKIDEQAEHALSQPAAALSARAKTLPHHNHPSMNPENSPYSELLLKGSDHKTKFLLTNREREVFELLVQDKTTRDIAGQLFISEKTVRNHISNVMQKLNVKGRSQAVVELIKLGELKI